MGLQSSIIEFKDENNHLLSRQIIPLEESYSIINTLVKDFLQKHWIFSIDREEMQNGYLGVLTSDDVCLDLKLLPDMYPLFNEIQEVYFEQRKKRFLFYSNQIQSFSINSSFDNRQSAGMIFGTADSKQLFARYDFLSEEETLFSKEQEFLDVLVDYFLTCNNEKLFLREIYDWCWTSVYKSKEKVIPISGWIAQNKGLASYTLQKGRLELGFNSFLLSYIMKKTKIYEKNTGQKLFRTLNGGRI